MPSCLVTLEPRLGSLVAFSNISWFYVIQSKKYLCFPSLSEHKSQGQPCFWCLPAVLHIRELDQLFVLLWDFFFSSMRSNLMHTGDNCLYWGALVKWEIMLIRKTFIPIRSWSDAALCCTTSISLSIIQTRPLWCHEMICWGSSLYSSSQAFPKLVFGVFHKD